MSCQPRERARRSKVKGKTAKHNISVGEDLKAEVTLSYIASNRTELTETKVLGKLYHLVSMKLCGFFLPYISDKLCLRQLLCCARNTYVIISQTA